MCIVGKVNKLIFCIDFRVFYRMLLYYSSLLRMLLCYYRRKKESELRGFFWTDTPDAEFVLVTSLGLEFFSPTPGVQGLRPTAFQRLATVQWFLWSHSTRILICGCGSSGAKLQTFQFSRSGLIRLPLLDLTPPWGSPVKAPASHAAPWLLVTPAQVWVLLLYRRVFIAYYEQAGSTLKLYRMYRDASALFAEYAIQGHGDLEVSVVDDVIVVHHLADGTASVLDIIMVSTAGPGGTGGSPRVLSPLCAPMRLGLMTIETILQGIHEDTTPLGHTEEEGEEEEEESQKEQSRQNFDDFLPREVSLEGIVISEERENGQEKVEAGESDMVVAEMVQKIIENVLASSASASTSASSISKTSQESTSSPASSKTSSASSSSSSSACENQINVDSSSRKHQQTPPPHALETATPQQSLELQLPLEEFPPPPLPPPPVQQQHTPILQRMTLLHPDLVLDQTSGRLYQLKLDLMSIACAATNTPRVLDFLRRRKWKPGSNPRRDPRHVMLSLRRRLVTNRVPPGDLRAAFDAVLSSHGNKNSGQKDQRSVGIGQLHHQVVLQQQESSGKAIHPKEIALGILAPLLQEHDDVHKKSDKRSGNAISQETSARIASISDTTRYLQAALAELLSCCYVTGNLPIDADVAEVYITSYVTANQENLLGLFLESHAQVLDSGLLAERLAAGHVGIAGHAVRAELLENLAMDMYRRLGDHVAICKFLLRQGKVVESVRWAHKHRIAISPLAVEGGASDASAPSSSVVTPQQSARLNTPETKPPVSINAGNSVEEEEEEENNTLLEESAPSTGTAAGGVGNVPNVGNVGKSAMPRSSTVSEESGFMHTITNSMSQLFGGSAVTSPSSATSRSSIGRDNSLTSAGVAAGAQNNKNNSDSEGSGVGCIRGDECIVAAEFGNDVVVLAAVHRLCQPCV